MKRVFSVLAVSVLSVGIWAQTRTDGTRSDSQSEAQSNASSWEPVPGSTLIAAELWKAVDSKKAKAGDKIELRSTMDVLSHGTILIPRNTKVLGHVVEAKGTSKASPGGRLGWAFDVVILKDGRQLRMAAVVQALARPLHNPALDGGGLGSDSGGVPPASAGQGDDILRGIRLPRQTTGASDTDTASSGTSADRGTATALGTTSQGVIGIKGLTLKAEGATTLLLSEKDNIRLEAGTQVVLRAQ